MLKFKQVLSTVFFLILSSLSAAHEIVPTSIAVYIQGQEYNHQIMLRNYSQDYWYSQGPMIEIAAHDVLGADFSGVDMCDNQPADAKVVV